MDSFIEIDGIKYIKTTIQYVGKIDDTISTYIDQLEIQNIELKNQNSLKQQKLNDAKKHNEDIQSYSINLKKRCDDLEHLITKNTQITYQSEKQLKLIALQKEKIKQLRTERKVLYASSPLTDETLITKVEKYKKAIQEHQKIAGENRALKYGLRQMGATKHDLKQILSYFDVEVIDKIIDDSVEIEILRTHNPHIKAYEDLQKKYIRECNKTDTLKTHVANLKFNEAVYNKKIKEKNKAKSDTLLKLETENKNLRKLIKSLKPNENATTETILKSYTFEKLRQSIIAYENKIVQLEDNIEKLGNTIETLQNKIETLEDNLDETNN